MSTIAAQALPVLALFAPACNPPTFLRLQLLAVAAVLTTGRRTVSNLLRTLGHLAQGAPSSYHRVLSEARWSGLRLAALLTRFLLRRCWPTGTVTLAGDDTVTEHPGRKVYGKARHRDPVRSSHSYTAWRWGHKWVVLAVLVRLPFAPRPWALPVLVGLYRSQTDNRKRGRPHRTPAQLMQLLLRLLLRWFPDRSFRFAGDGGYGSHDMADFARRTQGRLHLVSKFHPRANLYEPPPPVTGKKPNGRPRKKGAKLPSPQQVVAESARTRHDVAWYGGGRRDVEAVSGVGHWYKGGVGLVWVRWAFVHDNSGTHRDEYFYTTDPTLTPVEVIEHYAQRWNIETTFAEMRSYLGLETTRGRCAKTVLRAEPSLFGLYSVVALWYEQLPAEAQDEPGVDWEGKATVTFSDAITAVRRWLWTDWVFATEGHDSPFAKLPEPLRRTLLYALAPAA
ncbi:MAG TPA: transposase [Polyangia bacterium]|nr:transposase [Polyangia bacterium]